MLSSPETLLASQSASPVLLGVIIDVSASMRNSWRNQDGKQLPRIEVIRDVLNRTLQEEQRRQMQRDGLNQIDVFCLGCGFRYPNYILHGDIMMVEQDRPLEHKERADVVDLICDLLALGEILPTKKKLADFKERLNHKWQQCTHDICDQATIIENIFAQLQDYVQSALHDSAMRKHQNSLLYQLAYQKRVQRFHWFARLLATWIQNKETRIKTISEKAAQQYTGAVFTKANNDFRANQAKYVDLIVRHLDRFVEDYVAEALQALTLGFSPSEIVETLDEKRTLALAKRIYDDLAQEIRRHIKLISLYQQELSLARRTISARLDMKQVKLLTERFIQKQSWEDYLKPLIEQTVHDMFTQQFERQAQKSFSHWLRLAAACEVVRPLTTLSSLLPNIFEEQLYSDEVMFGTAVFRQALDRAAMRFMDERYKDHQKILLIISDGVFREEQEVMLSANLLKKRGVTIISGLIHERDVLTQLVKPSSKEWPVGKAWPTGAKRMLEIASEAPEQKALHREAGEKHLARALTGEKLCYQINRSQLLNDLIENVFEEYAPSKGIILRKSKRNTSK